MPTGAHEHQNAQGETGAAGADGAVGKTGQRGPRGKDSAPSSATLVFVILTIILTGLVAYQSLAFKEFSGKVCKLTKVTQTFRDAQSKSYQDFQAQERTNPYIGDDLRVKRVQTWQNLIDRAEDTQVPARKLCP